MKKITAFALAVCMLLLCSCGAQKEENKTINIGVGKITGNFNPFYAEEEGDLKVVNQVFDKIQRRGTDNKLINLAGSITYEYVGDTQVKYTVTIRDDLYFSNGNNVTIDDVIFFYYFISDASYDGIYSDFYLNDIEGLKEYYYDDADYETNKAGITSYADYIKANYADGADVSSISGIKRIDDYTCTVLFNSKNINAVSQLNVPIVSKAFYNENYVKGSADKIKSITDETMGSGPYFIKSYDTAKSTVMLNANTYYESAPHFDEVKMIQYDEDDAVKKIKSGKLDIISVDASSSSESDFSGNNLRSFVTNKDEYISLFVNTSKLDDREVRKQLLSIINPYDYISDELGKYYTQLYRPLSVRFAEYPDNEQSYYASVSDLSALKSQLKSVSLCYASDDDFIKGIADAVKSSLSMYGISCTVTACEGGKLLSAIKSGKADIWLQSVSDGATCDKYDYYNSNGALNYTGISDESIDSLTAGIRASLGYKNRLSSVSSLLDMVMEQAVELPICQKQIVTVYNSDTFSSEALNEAAACDSFDYALRILY